MVLRNGAWVQVGIVSYGVAGCADPEKYLGVYSRVSYLSSWIDSIIRVHAPGYLPGNAKKTTARKTTTKRAMCTVPCNAKRLLERDGGEGAERATVTVTVTETVCPPVVQQ